MEPGHYQSRHGKNLHISTSQNTLYNNEGVDQRLLDLIDVEMLPDDFDTDLEHVTDSTDIKRSWRELVDKEYLSTVPEIEQDRQEFIVSLVYTQREFIDDLDFLAKFLESLLDSPVMRPSLHALLLKTKKLYIPNNEFLVSLDQRQNADFPLVGGIADICDTAIKSFGNPNLFLEYSRTLKGALEDFKTELKRNDFLSKYIESWTQWSEAEYGQTKRVEMVMRSPVHHLARISNLLERILSRLPATNSLQHKHVDSNLLPDVIIRVKSMQREMTRQVGVEEVLSPLIRLDSTASNADKTDLEVKKRLQESANESAKAYETVRARSRRPQDNNIVRTESKVEKIKVELKEDAEFWHTSVPEEVIPLLDIGEKEVKRQGTIFELVRSYAKYVDQLDFLAKIVENLNVAIDNGTVIVKGEMITSSSKIAPTVMSPSSINNKSLPANTKLSDRFSSSGKAAIRRIFEQQKYVKRVFVEPTSVMSFQAIILSELRERQKAEHPLVTGVGDVLLRNFLELEPILAYAQRHVRVEKEFERQIATNESFEKFIEESRRSHPERKDIKDFYLARPKQFQFGLKLLVETLIKNTRSSLEEFKNSPNKRPLFVEKLKDEISSLTQAFDVLHKFISKMDDTVAKIMDEMKVDILLEKKLVWTPRVLPQINVTTDLEQIKNITRQSANELLRGKRLIREGPMAVKDKTLEIPIYVFLFENVLLITEARNNGETYKVFAKPVSLELIAFDDETTQQRKYQPDAPLTAIESMKDPTRRLLREPTNASLFGTLSVNSSTSTLTPQQKSSSFTITHLGNRKEPLGGTYLLRFPSEFEQEGWQNAIRVAREAYVTSLIPGSLTSTGMIFNIEEVANVPRLDVDGNIDEPKIAQIENLAANRPTGLGELVGNSISAIARIGLKHLIVGSSEGVYVVPEISWKSGDEGPSKAIRLPLTGMLSDKHEGYLQKISAIELMPEENTLAILADRTLYTFKLQLILDHCHLPRISKKNKASITPQVRGDSGFSFFGRKNNETQHTTKASDFRGEVLKKDINWMRLLCDRGGPGGGTGATAFSAGDYLTGLANGVHQEDGKATEYHNFLVAFRPALSETSVYVFEPSKLGDGLTRTKKLFAPSSKVTGAALFNGIIVLYTDTGFIKITYETAATSALLEKSEKGSKPLAMFRTGTKEFFTCFDKNGFFVKGNSKEPSRWSMEWGGSPTAFTLTGQFLFKFDQDFVEIRDIETGERRQVYPLRSPKYLCNLPSYNDSFPREDIYFIQDTWSAVPIINRTIYKLRINPDSFVYKNMLGSQAQKPELLFPKKVGADSAIPATVRKNMAPPSLAPGGQKKGYGHLYPPNTPIETILLERKNTENEIAKALIAAQKKTEKEASMYYGNQTAISLANQSTHYQTGSFGQRDMQSTNFQMRNQIYEETQKQAQLLREQIEGSIAKSSVSLTRSETSPSTSLTPSQRSPPYQHVNPNIPYSPPVEQNLSHQPSPQYSSSQPLQQSHYYHPPVQQNSYSQQNMQNNQNMQNGQTEMQNHPPLMTQPPIKQLYPSDRPERPQRPDGLDRPRRPDRPMQPQQRTSLEQKPDDRDWKTPTYVIPVHRSEENERRPSTSYVIPQRNSSANLADVRRGSSPLVPNSTEFSRPTSPYNSDLKLSGNQTTQAAKVENQEPVVEANRKKSTKAPPTDFSTMAATPTPSIDYIEYYKNIAPPQ